jgi:UPF0755 protein
MVRHRRTSRRKKSSGAGFLRTVFLVLLLAAGAGAAWLVFEPFGPATETFVEIAPGSSFTRVGRQLESAGIVRSRYAFDLMRWWKHGTLKAGEYRFDQPAAAFDVYARIARGDVFTKAVTIPEGANLFEIAARLEQAGFGAGQDFLNEAAKQVSLVTDLDPGAVSLEGYLFPDTYHFQRKVTAAQICAAMVKRFHVVAGQIGLVGLKGNVHRVVTLASLVERETALDSERPLVASVFENRLAKKMPLMTDPSVIYGLELEGRWRGVIHESDLKLNTPYNTYLHAGLPPGPVSNPGLRSLRAAMAPAKTDYLYFVAAGTDPQGGSLFASNAKDHARNVAGYRNAVKKAGGQ